MAHHRDVGLVAVRQWRARRRPESSWRGARPGGAPSALRRSGRSAPARWPRASAPARGCGDRRPRAARTRLRRSARAWSPSRRPACSSGPARSGRDRWPVSRAPFGGCSSPLCSAIARDCSPAPAPPVRGAARGGRAVPARPIRGCASGARPSAAPACVTSSCRNDASASRTRMASSSSRVSDVERSACVRYCVASAAWPRSSAAWARADDRLECDAHHGRQYTVLDGGDAVDTGGDGGRTMRFRPGGSGLRVERAGRLQLVYRLARTRLRNVR